MSLLSVEYRPRQPRAPIINRRSIWLLFVVMAAIVIVAAAIYRFNIDRPGATAGTTQTTVIRIVDARTNAPIPITVGGPMYAAADPWKRKITVTPPNAVRIQWVERRAPGTIYIASPGYQGIGISLGSGLPPTMSVGLWPAPLTVTPLATQKSIAPNPMTRN